MPIYVLWGGIYFLASGLLDAVGCPLFLSKRKRAHPDIRQYQRIQSIFSFTFGGSAVMLYLFPDHLYLYGICGVLVVLSGLYVARRRPPLD